ncbi:hypothetical protein HAX54_010031 [Datura stramonium]|uniref:Uncharacterized protein n=1 Tax=Datura stramonium TaxID=4076 RepID=A0ABS8TIG1_DATST|nr:hypothetical protein [Datura stramonium]
MISTLEAELEQARARIQQLEMERRSSKKKLEIVFLRKLSEEKAAWRVENTRKFVAIIDDMKADLSREKKNRQRLEIVNSKLVNELADAKLSAKRYLHDYEKERKGRLIEEVCEELAKEIGEDKAEVEALKRESHTLREEVDEERKMLHIEMSRLIAELESFLSSRGMNPEGGSDQKSWSNSNRQLLRWIFMISRNSLMNLQTQMIFSQCLRTLILLKIMKGRLSHEPHTVLLAIPPKICTFSPDGGVYTKDNFLRHSLAYVNQSDLEEDGSEWETVSHLDEQGSSYSAEGSVSSVNKNCRHSNVSRGEGTPITEISEVCSGPGRQLKKVSSISRLWKSNGENYKKISVEGINGRLSNGRLSAVPSFLQIVVRVKNSHKHSLKSKLLEARMESQKVQLRPRLEAEDLKRLLQVLILPEPSVSLS